MGQYADEITFVGDDKTVKPNSKELKNDKKQGKVMLEGFVDPEDSCAWMFESGKKETSVQNNQAPNTWLSRFFESIHEM